MGKFTDAVGMGFGFCPSPSQLAEIFASWHPTTDSPDLLDFPDSDDFAISPWTITPDKCTRVELSPSIAWKHRRIYGTVVRIEETKADNTKTPFRLDIACKIPFRADGHGSAVVSTLFALVRGYSSNAAITDPCAIMLGGAITGVVSANYSGSGRAQLDGWRLASPDEWKTFSPETLITNFDFGHFDEWTCDWSLTLGGSAFATHSPGENRINTIRIRPPSEDPHVFIRARREQINREDSRGQLRPLLSCFWDGAIFESFVGGVLGPG